MRSIFLSLLFCCSFALEGNALELKHIATLTNPCEGYSMINSVDFHPGEDLFARPTPLTTRSFYTKKTKIGLQIAQIIKNPKHCLPNRSTPFFQPMGKCSSSQTGPAKLYLLQEGEGRNLLETPDAVIPHPEKLAPYRFHGIAFSPCGQFLVAAYGAGSAYDKALAVFRFGKEDLTLELKSLLRGRKELNGTPKGDCLFFRTATPLPSRFPIGIAWKSLISNKRTGATLSASPSNRSGTYNRHFSP